MTVTVTAPRSIWRLARRVPGWAARRLYALRHAGELENLRREASGIETQYMRVITTLIKRHYPGAEVPPADLRLHVGAKDSVLNFWAKGISSSQLVLETFGEEPTGPVLDWGCGSGRTRFWLRAYAGWRGNYHGTDVDDAAIAFLRANGEDQVFVCGDDPPLPCTEGQFHGLFAFSVLTHIPPQKHTAWYEEIRRVLVPGGLAMVTTDSRHSDLPAATAAEFTDRDSVFLTAEGHYKHAARVTERFTRQALGDILDIEEIRPGGYLGQDVVLARRPL